MQRWFQNALLLLLLVSGNLTANDSPPLAMAVSDSGATIDADQQALEYAQVGEFLYDALPLLENKSYRQIKAIKGLLRETCVTEPSYVVDETQQRCTLVFKGLELSGVVHENQLALNHAVISSRKWPVKWQLNVGTAVSDLKAKFKQSPELPTPDVFYYGNESSSVSFFIKDGLIARIELNLYDG